MSWHGVRQAGDEGPGGPAGAPRRDPPSRTASGGGMTGVQPPWRARGLPSTGLVRGRLLAGLAVSGALLLSPASGHPGREGDRVSFLVTALAETSRGRTSVGRTLVDGPPGTDFTIALETGPFTMEARFRTDLAEEDRLTIRSLLRTRRSLGLSERGLPLYEEDVQRSRMILGFDEALSLLPFGGRGFDENLRIEIVPTLRPGAGQAGEEPLEIRILDPSPGGALQVRAERIPHHYLAEARLLAAGEPVAEGRARLFLEEPGLLRLAAVDGQRTPRGEVMEIDLEVGLPARACPGGPVSLTFDVHAIGPGGKRTEIGRKWAGAGLMGSAIGYELEPGLPGLESPSRLEVTIRSDEVDTRSTSMRRDTP